MSQCLCIIVPVAPFLLFFTFFPFDVWTMNFKGQGNCQNWEGGLLRVSLSITMI